VTIRPLVPGDVDAVSEADFAAFHDVALRHGMPPVVRSVRDSRAYVNTLLEADPLGGFVAEEGGRVVGHAWVHARAPIATIGPIAVEPVSQRQGVGRALLAHCVQAAGARAAQIRLVHESFNTASLQLYLAEGFRIVAPLLELRLDGPLTAVPAPSQVTIRRAEAGDQARMVARDARAFGGQRPQDVDRSVRTGRAVVAERGRTFAGYALARVGQLGAAAADDPEVVLAMLATLAADPAVAATAPRLMVLGTDRPLVDGLRAIGFRVFRACHYMIRGGGTAPPAGYVLMSGDLL
jgi:predicted N-acetyltransferase YhbS